jgi:long-chain acyl-CoA synthetase
MRGQYGIRKGDRAAIALGNRPEWPAVFFALLHAGAVPVPVNEHGSPDDLGRILADAGCSIAFTGKGCPALNVRSVAADSDGFWSALSASSREKYGAGARRDDIACIMYTSGTSSHPKGVVLSHGNLLSNMHSLYRLGFMRDGDGIVSILPLYHAYSMVVTTVGPLVYGGTVVYPGSLKAEEIKAAMKESGAVLFVGVPLVFEMFHKTLKESLGRLHGLVRSLVEALTEFLYHLRKATGINLARYIFYGVHRSLGKKIRAYMSGGARLSEKIEKDLFKFGFTVLNGYGLTETSPVLTVNSIKRPRAGSVGRPLRNVEVRISGADKNGVGEIIVRGPNVMKGYYKNEDLTRSVIKDGWLRTKDIGYMDRDGYLYVVGRADDVIALGTGLSVSPDALEQAYSAAGAPIKEICVFDARPPGERSDAAAVWAVIVPDMEFIRSKCVKDPYRCVKAALEKVSRTVSIPERLMGFSVTLDDLPRTLMGKVMRRKVRSLYRSGNIKEAFLPGEKRLTEEDRRILGKPEAGPVIECLRAWSRAKEIAPGDSFELDLGIDIAARAQVAFELEKRLGLRIGEEQINGAFTVGDLISRVEKIGGRLAASPV